MDALIAIFSILYIFWPLIPFVGFRCLFDREYDFGKRLLLAIQRTFLTWVLWAILLGFILWQGRQPVFIMSAALNYQLFFLLGFFTGAVTLAWLVARWRDRRIKLSNTKRLEDLLALSPDEFETLVAALFKAYGHEALVSGGNSDHGVDVVIYNADGEKWIAQCKRYSGSVGEPIVRDLYGTMRHEGAQKAYLITTGTFTAQASDWAEGKPIVLYDGAAMVKFIRRTEKRFPKIRK